MTYVVNPTDAATPTDLQGATQGAEEFRALKGRTNTLETAVAAITPGASSNISPVRQTVLQGLVTAGAPDLFAAGAAALTIDLKASTVAVFLAFASGWNSSGAKDYIESYTVDQIGYWSGITPYNTHYLAILRTAANTMNSVDTLAPSQWGDSYDKTRQSVLQFAGAAASVIFLDDFGNTWTAQGGAKVETNYFKFGTGALGGAGATNALNGAADYIKSTSFKSLGAGSWAMRCWTKPLNALPGAGVIGTIAAFVNAAGFGAELMIYNNAGTIKFAYGISSNGVARNIANLVQGVTTPVLGTEYFVELTYDVYNGAYRLYVAGAQESQTLSAERVCAITQAGLGALPTGANYYQGYIDKFELLPYCINSSGAPYAVPTTAPNITTVNYASDWFDTQQWLMKTPSVASSAAGANPTFVSHDKLYVGEADAGAAAIAAVRPYAYQGRYDSDYITPLPAVATAVSKTHNIGISLLKAILRLECIVAEGGFAVGDALNSLGMNTSAGARNPIGITFTNKTIGFTTGTTSAFITNNKTTGVEQVLTAANWKYKLIVNRDF